MLVTVTQLNERLELVYLFLILFNNFFLSGFGGGQVLKQASQSCAKKGTPSLETCFLQLLSTVDQLLVVSAAGDKGDTESLKSVGLPGAAAGASSVVGVTGAYRLPPTNHGHSGYLSANPLFSTLPHNQDYNIPYPRSSGARFCSVGPFIFISKVQC